MAASESDDGGKRLPRPAGKKAIDKVRGHLPSPGDAPVDLTLTATWRRAKKIVAETRRRHPTADDDAVVDMIVRTFERDVTAMGAVAGVAAASPGKYAQARKVGGHLIGSAVLFQRAALMILAVAHAYGHDLSEVEQRRGAVSSILSLYITGSEGASKVADAAAAGMAEKAVRKLPNKGISAVNQKVFNRQVVIKRPGTVPGKIPLTSVAHGGLGLFFGGAKNYVIGSALAALTVREFRPPGAVEPEAVADPAPPD
jgi:hypothetical protein